MAQILNVAGIMKSELELAKAEIQARMAKEKRNASGRTSRSIVARVMGNVGTLESAYALTQIQRGRGGGPVPRNFTAIIRQWILDKGVSYDGYLAKGRTKMAPEQKLSGLAGAIAYNIMKKGTLMHRKGITQDIYDTAIKNALDRIGSRVGALMNLQVQDINEQFKTPTK